MNLMEAASFAYDSLNANKMRAGPHIPRSSGGKAGSERSPLRQLRPPNPNPNPKFLNRHDAKNPRNHRAQIAGTLPDATAP